MFSHQEPFQDIKESRGEVVKIRFDDYCLGGGTLTDVNYTVWTILFVALCRILGALCLIKFPIRLNKSRRFELCRWSK